MRTDIGYRPDTLAGMLRLYQIRTAAFSNRLRYVPICARFIKLPFESRSSVKDGRGQRDRLPLEAKQVVFPDHDRSPGGGVDGPTAGEADYPPGELSRRDAGPVRGRDVAVIPCNSVGDADPCGG